MEDISITQLYIHPLKSARPIALQSMDIGATGPCWDREWMLIDEHGHFISQRSHPRLGLVGQKITENHLVLSADGQEDLKVDLAPLEGPKTSALIFKKEAHGIHLNSIWDQWFSDFLNAPVRLLRTSSETQRYTSKTYGLGDTPISFADGYPFLLTSESTLKELNQNLEGEPVTMSRFRPNIVIAGAPPNQEDHWPEFQIGDITFHGVKNCTRCPIVDKNPETLEKDPRVIETLRKHRRIDGKIVFGQNLIHKGSGNITVGDKLVIKG